MKGFFAGHEAGICPDPSDPHNLIAGELKSPRPSDERRERGNLCEQVNIGTQVSCWTAYDPGCVKTAEAPKPREWLSEIAQSRPRSEIAIAPIVVRGEISSINFPCRCVFTQPRPEPDLVACVQKSRSSHQFRAMAQSFTQSFLPTRICASACFGLHTVAGDPGSRQ
jgi:hypothetical protein